MGFDKRGYHKVVLKDRLYEYDKNFAVPANPSVTMLKLCMII